VTLSKPSWPDATYSRERVRLILDPRGFYRTEPIHQWVMGVDWAKGPAATSYVILRIMEDKILEMMAVPKELLNGK